MQYVVFYISKGDIVPLSPSCDR